MNKTKLKIQVIEELSKQYALICTEQLNIDNPLNDRRNMLVPCEKEYQYYQGYKNGLEFAKIIIERVIN